MRQTHSERTNREREEKRTRENQKRKKQEMEGKEGVRKGRAAYTHIHLAAGARKAQLVKVQGGHREEGAEQSWDGLVEAVLGWAGLGQRVQSRASSLQAMGSKPSL